MLTVAELIKKLNQYPPTMQVYLARDNEGLVCHELDTIGHYNHSIILYPNQFKSRRWTQVD